MSRRSQAGFSPADPIASFDVSSLLSWSADHFREYPWRHTTNPFHVLVAEFMLRRTRADQVVAVYVETIRRYPEPASVLGDSEETVARSLQALGLDWRIAQFRSLCAALVERFGGEVPEGYPDLTSLPGVGPYVASAVRVFAFNCPDAIADANVLRVVSRYCGIVLGDSTRRSARLLNALAALVPTSDPRRFWWAMIDFAADVCTARNPKHDICLLADGCSFVREIRREGSR